MKFRRLTNDELKELEKEFIRFLASNTITGDDWENIKKDKPEKADELINMFSDIVFEKTISNIKYLEHRSKNEIKIFHCQDEKIEMLGIRSDGGNGFDMMKDDSSELMMQNLQSSGAKLQLMGANKNYNKTRELEIFDMMQWGCLISDGKLFNTLNEMKPK